MLVTTIITYYDLNGQRVAQQRDGIFTWIHADHLSSATRIPECSEMRPRITAEKRGYSQGKIVCYPRVSV